MMTCDLEKTDERLQVAIQWPDLAAVLMMLAAMAASVLDGPFQFGVDFGHVKWGFFIGFLAYCLFRARRAPSCGLLSYSFFAFVLILTASTLVNSRELGQSIQRVFSFWILYLIAFVFVVPGSPVGRLKLWSVAWMLLCAAMIVLSLGRAAFDPTGSFVNVRFRGIMANTNGLAGYAATFLVGAAALYFGRAPGRYWWLGAMALGGFVLWATQSRGAILGTAAALAVILGAGRRWVWIAVVVLALLSSGMFDKEGARDVPMPLIGSQKVRLRAYPLVRSRIRIWRGQWEVFLEKPILGHGMEVSEGAGRRPGPSSYSDILAATGILGGLPFLLTLTLGTYWLYRRAVELPVGSRQAALARVALGIVVQILVSSVGEGYMAAVGNGQALLVWVAMGAAGQEGPPGPAASETMALPATGATV